MNLVYAPSPDIPALEHDSRYVSRMCRELIDNALSATPTNGVVEMRTEVQDGNVRMLVKEQGRGISTHVQNAMFEPFASRKDNGVGTGMGLLVVSAIVDVNGWMLDIATSSESGTTIIVGIPLQADSNHG